jgi:hypothetical protein
VERLHPVSIHEELHIDVHVAALELAIGTNGFLHLWLVQVGFNIADDAVAEGIPFLAFSSDIVNWD